MSSDFQFRKYSDEEIRIIIGKIKEVEPHYWTEMVKRERDGISYEDIGDKLQVFFWNQGFFDRTLDFVPLFDALRSIAAKSAK
jgi:hypothetical protein